MHIDTQGSECECNGSRIAVIRSKRVEFPVESIAVCDEMTLVLDSEEKVCRLMSKFGRVYERSNHRVRVSES